MNIVKNIVKDIKRLVSVLLMESVKTKRETEQKSVWNGEDEKMQNNLIRLLIRLSASTHTDSTSPSYSYPCEIDWLKSLKQRIGG